MQELAQPVVVRLGAHVGIYKGPQGGVACTAGTWALGREPWWRATDLTDPLADLVAVDDRRMAREDQRRDPKGCRLGLKRAWTLFRTPPYLPRFPRLGGRALGLWPAVGPAVAEEAPLVRRPGTRTGPRLSRLPGGIASLRKRARLVRRRARVLQQHLPRPQLPASSPGDKPLTSPHESEKRSECGCD